MPQYYTYQEGTNLLRVGSRNGYHVSDIAITTLGFSGTQNVDWKCIDSRYIPIMPKFLREGLLFYGRVQDISGGQMPNIVGIDYITVAGSAGSETYVVPNTVDYRSADNSDYFWFKYDTTRNTVTTADLIAYDFTKTLVKYDDSSPHTIREIAIFRSETVVTDAIKDAVSEYFDLYEYWSGTLNALGSPKDNRSGSRSVWVREVIGPTGFAFGTPTKTTIVLNWANVETGMPIEVWCAIDGAASALLFTTANNAVTYTHTYDLFTVSDAGTLVYKVRTKNGALFSNFSANKTVTVAANQATNGGGPGTTDHVDSNSDGIANNYSVSGGAAITKAIVTGNGFAGNAQRVACVAAYCYIYWPSAALSNTWHLWSCRMRSSSNYFYYAGVQINSGMGGGGGNATVTTGLYFVVTGGGQFNNYYWAVSTWGEIGELNLRKVTLT